MTKNLIIILFLLLPFLSNSQSIVRADSMELPSTWRGIRIPGTYSGYIGGTSSSIDNPPNNIQYVSLDTCYRLLGVGAGSSTPEVDTLLFPNVTGLSRSISYRFNFRLASIAYNPSVNLAAGVDLTDTIKVEYTNDGGTNPASPNWRRELNITGSGNASWGFNSVGQSINKTSSFPLITVNNYTSTTSNPITEVSLTLPTGYFTQLRFRITMILNGSGESFLIDNAQLIALTVLPIELGSFKVDKKDSFNKITWITLSEKNNDFFELYSSFDGVEFNRITKIIGAGDSNTPINYEYNDYQNCDGIIYYKLRQVDYNGNFEEFGPITLNCLQSKKVLKICNILGQEVTDNYQGVKIYFFDDFSIEKVK